MQQNAICARILAVNSSVFVTILTAGHALLVGHAHAAFDTFTVSTWGYGDITWPSVIQSIYTTLKASIEICSVAVFVLGALLYATSAGDEGRRGKGKSMMVWSLFALAIVVGANAIMRTISFFVWG